MSAGQTIQLGFGGTGGAAVDVPTGIVVTQIVPAFDLVSDTDGDLILDWVEICVNGTDPLVPEGVTPSPTPTPIEVTPTPIEVSPTPVEPTPTSVEPTPTSVEPTPTSTPDLVTDTDGDLIPDYYEAMLGTDPTLADTDGDEISDYDEVFILGFDPLSADGDANGISDYDEDVDQDGLSFRQEDQAGTNSYNSDTDADGLLDGEEINAYGTNPLEADTDADGLGDGDEIALGLNPLVADTDGNGVLDSQEKILQTVTEEITETSKPEVTEVSVSMNAAGNMQNNTQIKNVYNVDVQTSDVVGLIGAPVEITSDAAFDEATITFSYDDTLLGDTPEENLAIMWYDKANDEYIVLDEEDVLDTVNNTISYTTTHFSTYMVVDKEVWFEVWRQNLDTISEARDQYYAAIPALNFDFVFSIQGTSNMFPTMFTQAIQIQTGFIESMGEGDRGALLVSGEHYIQYQTYLNNKESLQTHSSAFYSSVIIDQTNPDRIGNVAYMGYILGGSNKIYDVNSSTSNEKVVIAISNGINIFQYGNIYGANIPPDFHPSVYTVRIGSNDSCDSILEKFAQDSGGKFFIADTSQNIMEAITKNQSEKRKEEIDITDEDEDGLPDIIETTGILLSNGRIIYTVPTLQDSDDDNLTDGAEAGAPVAISSLTQGEKILFYQGAGYTNMYNYCFKYSSNPRIKDTDGDEYTDDVDPRPKTDDVEEIKLVNDYVRIFYNASSTSYGGDQRNFITYSNGSIQDTILNQDGCGVIAEADQFLYWTKGHSINVTDETKIAMNGTDEITLENYMNYVRDIDLNFADCLPKIGQPGPTLAGEINYYAYIYELGYESNWEWSLTSESMYSKIEEMIKNDIPVIISIGPNLFDPLNITSESDDVKFYQQETTKPYTYQSKAETHGHYFTITGIIIDDIAKTTMLHISTWGEDYYMDYNAYREYVNRNGALTSSIISIINTD